MAEYNYLENKVGVCFDPKLGAGYYELITALSGRYGGFMYRLGEAFVPYKLVLIGVHTHSVADVLCRRA
jgi:hypothetical protein